MKNILDKYNLTIKIDDQKNELTILQDGKNIFLETDLTADDYELIKSGNLKAVVINALRLQIETDFDAIIEEINDDGVVNIVKYAQSCFEIYNELLNDKS